MKRKVTVIGAGNVGSTIAYTLAIMDLASEIVLIDINENKLVGEAMDIQQSTVFYSTTHIVAGDYPDAADSGIVIITSGLPRKPGQTRLDLTKANVEIMKSIAPKIAKYAPDAIYLIVSNPVDIMTYVFAKVSGIPENRVIGSAQLLIPRVSVPSLQRILILPRRAFTHTFSESTATPLSFRGRL